VFGLMISSVTKRFKRRFALFLASMFDVCDGSAAVPNDISTPCISFILVDPIIELSQIVRSTSKAPPHSFVRYASFGFLRTISAKKPCYISYVVEICNFRILDAINGGTLGSPFPLLCCFRWLIDGNHRFHNIPADVRGILIIFFGLGNRATIIEEMIRHVNPCILVVHPGTGSGRITTVGNSRNFEVPYHVGEHRNVPLIIMLIIAVFIFMEFLAIMAGVKIKNLSDME